MTTMPLSESSTTSPRRSLRTHRVGSCSEVYQAARPLSSARPLKKRRKTTMTRIGRQPLRGDQSHPTLSPSSTRTMGTPRSPNCPSRGRVTPSSRCPSLHLLRIQRVNSHHIQLPTQITRALRARLMIVTRIAVSPTMMRAVGNLETSRMVILSNFKQAYSNYQ